MIDAILEILTMIAYVAIGIAILIVIMAAYFYQEEKHRKNKTPSGGRNA